MECVFLETIKICKLYILSESEANDYYEKLFRAEREKRVEGEKLTKKDCEELYREYSGIFTFDYEPMKKSKLPDYLGLGKKDIRVDSESDEEEKIDVRDLFDFYYECMLVESTIYRPTKEDLNEYCISKDCEKCPRMAVYERFKKINSVEAPGDKRP
jgi:hypothetical protein